MNLDLASAVDLAGYVGGRLPNVPPESRVDVARAAINAALGRSWVASSVIDTLANPGSIYLASPFSCLQSSGGARCAVGDACGSIADWGSQNVEQTGSGTTRPTFQGNYLSFDGTDDFLTNASKSMWNNTNGPSMVFVGAFQPNTVTGARVVFMTGEGGGNFGMRMNGSKVNFLVAGANNFDLDTTFSSNTNIVCSYYKASGADKANTGYMFINGIATTSSAAYQLGTNNSDWQSAATTPSGLGRRSASGASYFSGSIYGAVVLEPPSSFVKSQLETMQEQVCRFINAFHNIGISGLS
jgi:hypothetical protein